ncbi:hypothetical protein V3481_018891 [Fusarium oxysporum f. sp. vasinfectum]
MQLALPFTDSACSDDPKDVGLGASPACKDNADEDVVGNGRACAVGASGFKSSSYR